MKITGGWISQPQTQAVMAVLAGAGHQALFVGGCVRNALIGQPVSDIDIATDALPGAVSDLASKAGLKVVPTGVAHGTVTVVSGGIPHEVTTFRRDVETDGRRAVVAFSSRIEEDAARRDFTMNALYADAAGHVTDPLGGLPDLLARRVRFVGDAEARIREDYLRILRFFRFHAWYGDPQEGPDAEGLAACAFLADGIEGLSRERVGAEVRKLLQAPDPAPSVAAMARSGILARILPGADDRALAPLVHLEAGIAPDWRRRLAALGDGWAEQLRLSRADASRMADLREGLSSGSNAAVLGYLHGADMAADVILLRAAALGTPPPDGWRQDAARGAVAVFPVKAADLMPGLDGPALGSRLKALQDRWAASGFALTRDELLRS